MNLDSEINRQQWSFRKDDFPLAISLTSLGALETGISAEKAPLIWILSNQEQFSVQPEKSRIPILLNGIELYESTWIKDGDYINLGDFIFDISISKDQIIILQRETLIEEANEPPSSTEPEVDEQSSQFGKKILSNTKNGSGKLGLSVAAKSFLSIFVLLLIGVVFVLIASPIHVRITPKPKSISLTGFPPPIPISNRYLALPGDYTIEANAPGYKVLKQRISVAYGSAPTYKFKLKLLPGFLSLSTPPIKGANVLIDNKKIGLSPLKKFEIDAGKYELKIETERYLPEIIKLNVLGKGEHKTLNIKLKPGWGTLTVNSQPSGATVKKGGKVIGITPLKYEPLQGIHELKIFKEGWKPVKRKINIKAGITTSLPVIKLEKIDGTLKLISIPAGATILVDGKFQSRTPASFPLVSDRKYKLKLSKKDYNNITREIRIEGGKSTTLSVNLKPEFGTVFLTISPPGAKIKINGKSNGTGSQRLKLHTVPQVITISKPGHIPFKKTIIPRRGIPKKINVTLKTIGHHLKAKAKRGVRTSGGQRLRLVYIQSPIKFLVGASRREPGRRSNEVQYSVELSRSFWISEKEVTNKEFKKFLPNHSSGNYRGTSLDGPNQPAVNLSWQNAAGYANWLSKKSGLTPAYKEEKGKFVSVLPLNNGYRLPTEAEWEFVSRYEGEKRNLSSPLRYPWGVTMPPPKFSGNYADDGAKRLAFAIPGYIDSFPVSAPVGQFKPNKLLIYDLGGNAAEWCHDYYDIPLHNITKPIRDPLGPQEGRFHVIKGSSWRSGSITELRLSYRDYAEKPRIDVGFRIVRYVGKEKK